MIANYYSREIGLNITIPQRYMKPYNRIRYVDNLASE